MDTNDIQDLRVKARTARLHASESSDDGPPYTFSGIAVAAGDILHMDDGTPVLFREEELKAAAETQAGEPLTADHPTDDDGRPIYPPPTDETVGSVPKAGWLDEQRAVGYEATAHDESIAKGVQAGSYDVSVHPTFDLGEQDPETGAYVAENIAFRDLSVVSKGDSPSNTAEWGPNHALASFTQSTDIGAQLPDADDSSALAGGRNGLISSTVRGTLEALGFDPESTDQSTMGAESPAGSDADDTTTAMDSNTREEYRSFLTANTAFDETSVSAMDDGVLEQTYELAAEAQDADGGSNDPDPDDDPDDDPDGGSADRTLGDMTVGELGEALREQGFVTEENAGDLVQEAQAQASKAEQVEELIAKSDDFDEADREGLMASSDALVERELTRVRGATAAQIPGAAGASRGLTASAGGDADDDLDAYGTGVQEE